ncbi:putative inactive tyrosine-protein kinase Wsck [Leptopilina boulardi]|uniref:putative inactive tyrosine-protein kinase Wsck n=1 Tax=Leptopilina boulardi TaxID=63433 RepID=UPI0021F62A4A|nr:putative inactive tyrosine-protein kinase Wsck [Leptopilina boulardi]
MFLLWCIFLLGVDVLLGIEYLGCYESSSNDPELNVPSSKDFGSPEGCIDECRSHYFMFAGLMAGHKCYCGSAFGKKGLSENCTMPCSSTQNDTNMCGSFNAMSIYATGRKGPSPPRRIDIYHDQPRSLRVTWQPPDNPNGNLTSYTLRAEVIKTYATTPLPPIEIKVEGGFSNTTVFQGLQPGTEYNISIVAHNVNGVSDPVFNTDRTLIGPPNKPETPRILEKFANTMIVEISRGSSENGPITFYQIVVVLPGIFPPTGNDIAYPSYHQTHGKDDDLGYYVTAEFDDFDFPRYSKFTVGNGKTIGGYYNSPFELNTTPQIGLVIVSRNRDSVQYSYSDLTKSFPDHKKLTPISPTNVTAIILWIAIVILSSLLLISIVLYFVLKRKHRRQDRMHKLPEQQELTLQGPLYEVDNMAYIPEDMPEQTNHYQDLKLKIWTIPRNFLNFDNVPLRRSRFGTIHWGQVQKDGITISSSVHKISDTSLKKSEKRQMLRELDICIKGGSMKFLAGLIGTCETSDTLFIAIEMPSQTLKNKLLASRSGEIFPSEKILKIGSSIAAALRHLENNKIIHNQLCARSIGIASDWTPKVMGHGIGKYALEDFKYARWTAIECFSNQKKHQAGVVWAFGVLLWEMLSMGGTPYSNLQLDSDVEEALERGVRLEQLRDTPDPVYEVMLSCWSNDEHERPTFDELIRLDTLSLCPITTVTEPYLPELELN